MQERLHQALQELEDLRHLHASAQSEVSLHTQSWSEVGLHSLPARASARGEPV